MAKGRSVRARAVAAALAVVVSGVSAQDGGQIIDRSSYNPVGKPVSEAISAWALVGNAAMFPDFIRLTADEQHQRGVAVTRAPATELGDEWTADITMRIHGNGVSLAGDGAAFWYTAAPQHVGELVGADGRYTGLGLFVDTYVNSPDQVHPHPYVSIVANDGSEVAAHDLAGFHTSLHPPAGCPVDVRQIGQFQAKYTTLRLVYAHRTLTLWQTSGQGPDAYLFKPEAEWSKCTEVQDIGLPAGYYFGASATTGEVSDNHDVYRFLVRAGGAHWPAAKPVPPPPVAQQQQQAVPPQQQLENVQPGAPPPTPAGGFGGGNGSEIRGDTVF